MAVTGGVIETKKSYFYIIDYKKLKGKWKAFNPNIGDKELTVLDKDGNRYTLDSFPCGEAAEMLGVWMAMNGDKSMQIEVLQKKVLAWTDLVRAGTCTQEVVWHTFQITISKQIEYILLSHTLTEKECTKIFAPAIKIACQKSGYSSTLRRIFSQTSSAFFGAGAMNVFQQSGVLKVTALVMYSRRVVMKRCRMDWRKISSYGMCHVGATTTLAAAAQEERLEQRQKESNQRTHHLIFLGLQ